MTERSRPLPLLGPAGHAGRDAMPCLYRCGNACEHPISNRSGEISGASLAAPASTWPDGDFAKPGVVVSWRLDGGPVGS